METIIAISVSIIMAVMSVVILRDNSRLRHANNQLRGQVILGSLHLKEVLNMLDEEALNDSDRKWMVHVRRYLENVEL